jgi:hypothetical protein
MKKSDEQKEKREFPKDWKPIARVPKECLEDIGDIRLEFVGKLTPELLTEILSDNDVKIIELKPKN